LGAPRKRPEDKLKVGAKKWAPTEEDYQIIQALAEKGCTHTQILDGLGIGSTTFYNYKKEHPDFDEFVKKCQRKAIAEIEHALFRSGKRGNTAAMIFYLKCRSPKKWNDRSIIRHENADGKTLDTAVKNNIILVPAENKNIEEWTQQAQSEHESIKSSAKRNLDA
jgi:hypothetical protein